MVEERMKEEAISPADERGKAGGQKGTGEKQGLKCMFVCTPVGWQPLEQGPQPPDPYQSTARREPAHAARGGPRARGEAPLCLLPLPSALSPEPHLLADQLQRETLRGAQILNVMLFNHPKTSPTPSQWTTVFHEAGPRCPKGWGPLL